MSELLKLAERCELATGPDRDLDVAILTEALGYRDVSGDGRLFDRGNDGYWSLDGDDKNPPLPTPTASLDAALTLVPGGMTWLVRTGPRGLNGDLPYARVNFEPIRHAVGSEAEAQTPALALCAAALRARAEAAQ